MEWSNVTKSIARDLEDILQARLHDLDGVSEEEVTDAIGAVTWFFFDPDSKVDPMRWRS